MNTFINSYNQEDRKKYISLKNLVHKEKIAALKNRLKSEPSMDDLEYLLGAFLEMYEPYLREVVIALSKKGYVLETSSGFGSNNGEYQSLDGYFSVDYVTRNKLEKNGIKVRENNGFKSLVFRADKLEIDYIKNKWLEVIKMLPDKGVLTQPSTSPQAVKSRRKYVSKNPLLQKQRYFEKLEHNIHTIMQNELKNRKKRNPKPDKLESRMGLFIEELEPQIRKAVLEMVRKGYSVDMSGFMNNPVDQMVEGDFSLAEKSIEKLKTLGVIVETNPSGYTRLQFSSKEADINKIKQRWNKIVSILPDKNKLADASMTHKARDFRIKF